MANIGQIIKERRIKVGLTADQLAEKLGKSRATIYRYESSDADNMPINILKPLAEALGTTPAELMGWSGTPAKVATHLSFEAKSPENDLYQYYVRRPEAVKKEIIKRLKNMDVTFSKNVSKLLQDSGSVDEFMKYTGIQFAIVGKLMQGEPTETAPDEAERIAEYFKTDVVNLFFDESITNSDEGPPNTIIPTLTQKELGPHAKRLSLFIKSHESKLPYFDNERKEHIYAVLRDERLEKIINDAFDAIGESDLTQADFDDIYAIIAKKIFYHPENFRMEYFDSEIAEYQLRQLISSKSII
jgi:transcriptional regulator with XRE-family HTH domain